MSEGTVIVQKYGGSSVSDAARIQKVAERVARTRAAGHRLVVVVSAMGDSTDDLLALARQIHEDPPRRELDMLLTAGERISMALLSMALHKLGVEAISFTGSQSGIITNDAHAGARIVEVRPYRIEDELERGKVVIVAGYQGVSYRREVTTLGRGGSDTSAVALAAALGAEYCEICSDVDGVFTADPRVVTDARRLAELTHEEMQVLSECGAKVLHATAVEYARQHGIVIWARATSAPPGGRDDGTMVRVAGPPMLHRIAGVASREVALLRCEVGGDAMQDVHQVETLLRKHGVQAIWVAWTGDGAPITAVLPLEDVHAPEALAGAASLALGGEVSMTLGLSAVSVVGAGLDADSAVLDAITEACDGLATKIHAVERTSMRATVVVDAARCDPLRQALHDTLLGPNQ